MLTRVIWAPRLARGFSDMFLERLVFPDQTQPTEIIDLGIR